MQMNTQNNVPVIDIAQLGRSDTLASLDTACREWGFFQVVNHGIPTDIVGRIMHEARGFFDRPLAAKRAITRTAANPWGFFDRELTKNTRDWKQIYDYGPADGGAMAPQWPSGAPGFRSAVLDYYGACEKLAFRLLGAVTRNLGADPDHLFAAFAPRHTSFLRLNYYPRCPKPERPEGVATPKSGHLALNHHTDSGALTLLLQDQQAGLEVMRDGRWHLVEPRSDALVVNIGDIVQVWSNDRYQAALHRVLANSAAERFSVPFFFSPAYSAEYAPLPTTVDALHPARYRAINWGEFYRERTAGDYADHGEEIQISHYRTA
jgi:isopenicillin N synthase-like dioxygenase